MLGSDVMFEFNGVPDLILASDPLLGSYALQNLVGVVITNSRAKSDALGEGNRFHFPRQLVSGDVAFDFVEILFKWALRARVSSGDWFLSYRQTFRLSGEVLNQSLKKVASRLGLNVDKYSSHSLRIGGASVLAAAGVPDYVIMKMGRWKSLAFLMYIRAASSMFRSAMLALSNPHLLTCQHIKRLNSAVN
jgi:hypothetical protein